MKQPMPASFPPLTPRAPKILILGSMPGEMSLLKNQYYAHPQNRFWKIMFRYFGAPFSGDYEARKTLALQNGVALWETIALCERENSSLDSFIKNPKPNDIAGFLRRYPSVQAVFTNGGTSTAIFQKNFPQIPATILHRALPSTSPANARMDAEILYAVWEAALDEALNRNNLEQNG